LSDLYFNPSFHFFNTGAHALPVECNLRNPDMNALIMNYHIDIQHASEAPIPVTDATLTSWATYALNGLKDTAELTLRFVDTAEITHLNHEYRKINKATNVLAFPASYPKDIALDYPLLGDIVICPQVLLEESISLKKPLVAHWAHIVIHGVLHLLDYDHIEEAETKIMQTKEIELLLGLGFEDPYTSIETEAK